MKKSSAFLLICLIVIADQALKIYIKTHYFAGESHLVLGHWFQLYFIENEGMAYGWKFGGEIGKMGLTLFRLAAVIFGVFYIKKIIDQKYNRAFVVCVSLIFAGALGNLIDSMFYGMIFSESQTPFHLVHNNAIYYAKTVPWGTGYGNFLYGRVVDMLYFPIVQTRMPSWVPFIGGHNFTFFEPVFNIADASISVGVLILVFFQKRLIHKKAVAVSQ